MLNVGQVVYDENDKRVIIFAGLEMLQNQKTGKCTVESGFILPDGSFLYFKDGDGKERIKYTNLNQDGKPISGSFISKCGLGGCYFGVISDKLISEEMLEWAKEAIQEIEALIAEHGLNTEERESHNGPYTSYHIGPIVEHRRDMVLSAPNVGGG